jgi:hypothetical protein
MIRLLLVLGCVVLVLVALAGMRLGWRNRERRQATLPPLPAVPADLGSPRLPAATGVYVGTTFAASWQDRVVHGGLGRRAEASLALYDAGALIDRTGAEPVFVPAAELLDARLAPALAGKVMGAGGLLVLRWRLGAQEVDTGFRADDKSVYPSWVRALTRSTT